MIKKITLSIVLMIVLQASSHTHAVILSDAMKDSEGNTMSRVTTYAKYIYESDVLGDTG